MQITMLLLKARRANMHFFITNRDSENHLNSVDQYKLDIICQMIQSVEAQSANLRELFSYTD